MTELRAAAPSITSYGDANADAPRELRAFEFLIGRWEGTGTTRLPEGKVAEFPIKGIGRYVLDGMAIADESHSTTPDGAPYFGITLRFYDSAKKSWVVEFLNVNGSFLRRQVNPGSGAVQISGRDVVVMSQSEDAWIRETYHVASADQFTYKMDLSQDRGQTWTLGQVEMKLARKEAMPTSRGN